jgi:hypothetical protein
MFVYTTDMSRKKEEKNLGGMMSAEVVDTFSAQVQSRNYKSKRALEAAVRVWVNLPEDVQRELYSDTKAPPLDSVIRKVLLDLQKSGMLRSGKEKK